MDLMEAVRARHSVRSYLDTPIEAEKADQLRAFIDECNGESGLRIQLILEEPKAFSGFFAHYGMFSGVKNYIALVGEKGEELEEKCGRIIRGMAYPDTGIVLMRNFGDYQAIKNYLTELDIAYARTLGSDNDSFLIPEDFHAWMPSAHHTNPKLME